MRGEPAVVYPAS